MITKRHKMISKRLKEQPQRRKTTTETQNDHRVIKTKQKIRPQRHKMTTKRQNNHEDRE